MAAVVTDDGKVRQPRLVPHRRQMPASDVTGQPKQIFSFAEAVDNETVPSGSRTSR
jgi:hypothetical protein